MATTKLSTDVIDLSGNTGGLIIPSGTTAPTASVDYLLVGGGAGGGTGSYGNGGGGGGGGVISTTTYGGTAAKLEASAGTTYTFSVGGGSSGNWQANPTISYWISSAGSTTFNSLTALGGGNGGQGTGPQDGSSPGEDGASGGGGGGTNFSAYPGLVPQMPGGSATQGNAGGDGVWYGVYYNPEGNGGGGGGAGTAGTIATSSGGGAGGDGVLNSITGSAIYYGAGGGGGRGLSGALPAAQGGLGGGGDGGINNTSGGAVSIKPTNGERGKGAGGGGGMDNFTYTGYAGNGGSFGGNGVAIFRMPSNTTATFSSPKGLSPSQFSGNSFAEFNGIDSRMWFSGTDGTDRTYSFWVKPNTTTGNGGVASWWDNAGDYTQGGAIRDLNNNWVLAASNGSNYTIGANSTSTWDHIVVTSTSSNTKVYLNGTKTVDVSAGGIVCDNLSFGARNTTGTWQAFVQFYNGKMFNLRCFKAELDQTSVNALNAETNSTLGSNSFPSGYVTGIAYPFHQGSWGPGILNGSYGDAGAWANSWNSLQTGGWVGNYWRDVSFHGLSSSLDTSTGDNIYTVDYAGPDTTVSFSTTGGAGRPSSPTEGLLRDNTTTGALEFYNGSLWQQISGTLVGPPPVAADNFNTLIYQGDGAGSKAITGIGFTQDLTVIKAMNGGSGGSGRPGWYDTVRGAYYRLYSNLVNVYGYGSYGVTAFGTDGFTVNDLNSDGDYSVNGGAGGAYSGTPPDYVSWNWKAGGTAVLNENGTEDSQVSANIAAGFSIVSYTTQSSGTATVGHGLSSPPDMIIVKTTGVADSWRIYNSSLGADKQIFLNETTAASIRAEQWNNTSPTNSVFSLGTDNAGSYTTIAYCWHSVPGYSKIGFYVGNGSTTGPEIYTGFKPAWLMTKPATTSGYWYVLDNKRNTSNPRNTGLFPNDDIAESTDTNYNVDFNNTGFQPKNNTIGFNNLGVTYIYMTFAE